ncbi:MAG: TetR/AcrR family transcriptional regulator [Actinomycetota bacterium]
MARPTGRELKGEVLAEATLAIQRRGVEGLSYGSLAERLGVRAPSIHHHFRRKDELVLAVTAAYCDEFQVRVDAIDDPSPSRRVRRYAELFDEVAADGRLCLCGAVAADWATVDDEIRRLVSGFFADQATWLTRQLDQATADGELAADTEAGPLADALLAALEGSLLVRRADVEPAGAAALVDTMLTLAGRQAGRGNDRR